MKKIFVIMFFLLSFGLFACERRKSGLVINKLLTPDRGFNNNLLELKNTGKADVNLKDYKVAIYPAGDVLDKEEITLKDTILKPGQVYKIGVNKEKATYSDKLKDKVDQWDENLSRKANACVSILKDGKIVDIVGFLGADANFSEYTTLVRFKDKITQSNKFEPTDYCYFKSEYYDIFLQEMSYTYDEILKGPQLSEIVKNEGLKILNSKVDSDKLEFLTDVKNNTNSKKIIKVSVSRYVDGDTTKFSDLEGKVGGDDVDYSRVRYQGMDTPESQRTKHIDYEPYGKIASAVTKYILKSSSKSGIYVQISGEGPTIEGNGRALLLVWTNKSLVPFTLVKNGLAKFRMDNIKSTEIFYNNISMRNYLQMAEYYAKSKKLNLWSGKSDPTYDYKKGEYKSGVTEDTIDVHKFADLKDYE